MIRPSVKRTSPPTITVWARARTSHPPNGLLRLLDRNWEGSIVQGESGSMIADVCVRTGPERPFVGEPQQVRRIVTSLPGPRARSGARPRRGSVR